MSKDSIEKAAGVGPTIVLGGREYEIKPLAVGDYIALRSHIRSQRIADFRKAAGDMESSERIKVIMELSSSTISEYELMQESVTPDGMLFMFWRILRKTDPNLEMDGVEALLEGEDLDDLMTMAQTISEPEGTVENPPVVGTG